ncbi:MAG TPA: penicillin-binding protein [Cyclobacteriaceae bacterium]|nr:penicillin-binding protein [Cyclobacteriaceae bacterium]
MNIKQSILIRVRVSFILMLLFTIAITVKMGHIQFVEGKEWEKMGEEVSFQFRTVKATRGNIYSDNGSLLATSLPFYKVAFDATLAKDEIFANGIDSLAYLLAKNYGDKTTEEYRRMIKDARSSGKRYIVLNRKQINYQQKKEMSTWPIFREGRYRGGVIFEKMDVRYRPFNNLSRRTIGFLNEDNAGAGLEFSFNDYLAGRDGEALYQKISGGEWKPIFDADNVKAVDGLDIETTIDINLQDVSETALLRSLERHKADEGIVVVMEVKTGEIKAISNLTRDQNGFYYEKYNHAIGGLYEPGSTFKLLTMMALLEDTNLNLSDTIDTGKGEFTFYKNKVRDHHEGGHGKITIREAFEKSSNIAMARLVDKYFGVKPSKFIEHVDRLKLSQPLGMQISGEAFPKVPRPTDKDWSGITLPWMAYGYGLELSPMQVLTLYNAIANDGKMIRPIIVKSVRKADKVRETYKAEVINSKICSRETLLKLRILMEGVVEYGTANNIRDTHYKIAGKTGTAQILENGKYTKKYLTSFVGYFPAHQPKYSAFVLVKNPKGWQQYGSNVAAPVFKEISDNIYARDIALHKPELLAVQDASLLPVIRAGKHDELRMLCNELGISNYSDTEEDWVKAVRNGNSVLWKENKSSVGIVPDVNGMTLRDAIYLLEQSGFNVQHDGYGRVAQQSLAPGTKSGKGTRVYIKLS